MVRLSKKDVAFSDSDRINLEVILLGFAKEHNIKLEELDLTHFIDYEVKAIIVKSLNFARKFQESLKNES